MSFLGKRFKRARCENLEQLLDAINASDHFRQMLTCRSAIFSFGKKDDSDIYTFMLERDGKVMSSEFRSGEEHEQRRRDGCVVKVTYTVDLEANTIYQIINQEDGKVVHFKREFGDKEVKLTINHQDSDLTAHIYYEAV